MSFILLVLTLRCSIYFHLFCVSHQWGFKLIVLYVNIQYSKHHFLKLVISPLNSLGIYIENHLVAMWGFINGFLFYLVRRYICIFIPAPHWVDYSSFLVRFEMRKSESMNPSNLFFCKCLWLLLVPWESKWNSDFFQFIQKISIVTLKKEKYWICR